MTREQVIFGLVKDKNLISWAIYYKGKKLTGDFNFEEEWLAKEWAENYVSSFQLNYYTKLIIFKNIAEYKGFLDEQN